jgi:hypothetical protein
VEGTELYGNAGTDTDKRCQSPFIKCEKSFGLVDSLCCYEGIRVSRCGLQSDLDNIKRLPY